MKRRDFLSGAIGALTGLLAFPKRGAQGGIVKERPCIIKPENPGIPNELTMRNGNTFTYRVTLEAADGYSFAEYIQRHRDVVRHIVKHA